MTDGDAEKEKAAVLKYALTILMILTLSLSPTGPAQASWLDKLKETATELTDKAGEALKEAEPETPTTSDGEGQPQSPSTATPAKPATPKTGTVTAPTAPKAAQPAPVASTGNNNKTLVRDIQQELKRLGYSIGVDGAYGPNTKKQIIAFEQSQSLEPSGDASVELLAKLKETQTPSAEPAPSTAATPAPMAAEPKAETVLTSKTEEPKVTAPKIEKAAASTPVTTAVAAPAPKYPLTLEGKMAFENCDASSITRTFYSCQCIAEQTPAFVETEVAKRIDSIDKLNASFEETIKKNEANTKVSEKQKEQTNNYLRDKIKKGEQNKALLQSPSSSWDDATRRNLVQSAELHLYKEPTCKVGDGMREKEYDSCMKSPSTKNIKGKTPEDYCRCSADTAANLWTSSTQSYSSKVAVSLPVQARTQCRN